MKERVKSFAVKLGGILALLVGIPVIWRIHEGDILNPMSYFLWTSLSIICAFVLFRAKKGGVTMLLGYIVSDFSIGFYAYLKSGKAEFGRFEWAVAVITAFCAIIYIVCELRQDYTPSVIVNTTACIVAGVPLVADSYKHPHQMSFLVAGLYLLVSGLSFWGEKPNLHARLLPGASAVYWIVIIIMVMVRRQVL